MNIQEIYLKHLPIIVERLQAVPLAGWKLEDPNFYSSRYLSTEIALDAVTHIEVRLRNGSYALELRTRHTNLGTQTSDWEMIAIGNRFWKAEQEKLKAIWETAWKSYDEERQKAVEIIGERINQLLS